MTKMLSLLRVEKTLTMRCTLLVAALCLALCIVGASGAAGTRGSFKLRQTALAVGGTEWSCSVGLRVGRAQGGVLGLRGGGEDGEDDEEEAAGGDEDAAVDDEMDEEEEEEEEKDEGMNINKAIRQVTRKGRDGTPITPCHRPPVRENTSPLG